jgi:hypothetical protein
MDADLLILWVHYHDILGKFTSRHWRTQSAESASIFNIPGMTSTLASVAHDQVGIAVSLIVESCADINGRFWAYLGARWK